MELSLYWISRLNLTESLSVAYDGQNSSPSHYPLKPAPDPPALPQAGSVEQMVEYSDDPWRITVEQLQYYTHQFRTLQPDLSGLILGTVAKNFFTKSKLPIPELSHIWELSDVDRDGALSFPEFCTAFHLVVARKNGYPLPERLPHTLQAAFGDQSLPQQQNPQPLVVFDSATPRAAEMGLINQQEVREEMYKLEFSPKREADPQDQQTQQTSTLKPDPPQELELSVKSRTRPRSYSSTSIDDAMKKVEEPPTPPPRPQKTHSRASSLDLNKLFQQGGQGVKSGWLPPPPALPPRPPASQQISHYLPGAENSQQAVQQPHFADFSKFREEEESGVAPQALGSQRTVGSTTEASPGPKTDSAGLFQGHVPQKPMRRKLHPDGQNTVTHSGPAYSSSTPTTGPKTGQRLPARQKREIQMAIRKNKETNAVLTRLNSELQQQLKEVHLQRVTLESQLDLLRPTAST
ncbi:ralBP1-associated Eps domain-containing protein 2 isoform X1 [Astyanax mexicanus]|uniref:ralBP1-associated Eps domain-containing protein 2 isoform X1 n=1 Tax=Astyanax mexicanus TaxID=7994 RepID=UPI0020CAB680|nr:ralBP1-associated Eps domain-containing protein 2 isoform X1 [Astyanax mexicanus]